MSTTRLACIRSEDREQFATHAAELFQKVVRCHSSKGALYHGGNFLARSRLVSGVRLLIILIAASLFLTLASRSEARRVYRFGKRESIGKIQDVDLRDKDGQPLVLAHKITVRNFVAGISLHDDGYVLQRKDKTHYDPLTPEQIAQYQAAAAGHRLTRRHCAVVAASIYDTYIALAFMTAEA